MPREAGTSGLTLLTVAFNNVQVIETQAHLVRRHVLDPHRYVVVDNSTSRSSRRSIRRFCESRSIEYFRLPRSPYTGRDPSFSHGEALNYAVRNLPGLEQSLVVGFLDHDVFPTQPLSILEHLGTAKAYGRRQSMSDGWYLWPGLAFFRCDSVPLRSLDFRPIPGRGDTGARLFAMLAGWGNTELVFTHSGVGSLEVADSTETFELHDGWAHTLSASGWRGADTDRARLILALRQEHNE